jgi:hypothetical protein
VCAQHEGELFDAAQFADGVWQLYGLRIPRLAVLGLADQLERDGLLVSISGKASSTAFRYTHRKIAAPDGAHPVTEAEIDTVLADFATVCKADPLLIGESEETLHEEFLDRLLHTESMKLLSRREGSTVAKPDTGSLSLRRSMIDPAEQRVLRLDFHVAQYLLDLQAHRQELFSRVSDIAFANMAAEALACFSDSENGTGTLEALTVYLDSPLLLDILGVNVEYSDYGQELLQMILDSGAQPAVFDDCISEAESVVAARLAAHHTGLAQRTSHWGASTRPHVLTALQGNIATSAESKGFQVHRDPNLALFQKAKTTVGDIQADMTKRMQAWPSDEARKHDERSVWAMLRVRRSTTVCRKVSESKCIFIARNTALVRIANDAWRKWLKDTTAFSQNSIDRWAPVGMSDKQLAGYLWLRRGSGNGTMSKARLLAHCSEAIRPRADVKAKAYNLVLDLHGKQDADYIAALLEDKDGERALMRVAHADPEDVTKERLPYILEIVKREAGEYAAKAAREEAQARMAQTELEHQKKLGDIEARAVALQVASSERENVAIAAQLQHEHERQGLEREVANLKAQKIADELAAGQRLNSHLKSAFAVGAKAYVRLRFELVALFGALSLWISTSANSWDLEYQLISTFVWACLGFWFVPEFLENFVAWHSRRQTLKAAESFGVRSDVPAAHPNFKAGTWNGIQL